MGFGLFNPCQPCCVVSSGVDTISTSCGDVPTFFYENITGQYVIYGADGYQDGSGDILLACLPTQTGNAIWDNTFYYPTNVSGYVGTNDAGGIYNASYRLPYEDNCGSWIYIAHKYTCQLNVFHPLCSGIQREIYEAYEYAAFPINSSKYYPSGISCYPFEMDYPGVTIGDSFSYLTLTESDVRISNYASQSCSITYTKINTSLTGPLYVYSGIDTLSPQKIADLTRVRYNSIYNEWGLYSGIATTGGACVLDWESNGSTGAGTLTIGDEGIGFNFGGNVNKRCNPLYLQFTDSIIVTDINDTSAGILCPNSKQKMPLTLSADIQYLYGPSGIFDNLPTQTLYNQATGVPVGANIPCGAWANNLLYDGHSGDILKDYFTLQLAYTYACSWNVSLSSSNCGVGNFAILGYSQYSLNPFLLSVSGHFTSSIACFHTISKDTIYQITISE